MRTVHEPCLEPLRMMLACDPAKRPDLDTVLHTTWFYDPIIACKKDRHLARRAVSSFIAHRAHDARFVTPPASPAGSPEAGAPKRYP